MDNDEHPEHDAEADQDEAIFSGGVLRIGHKDRIVIGESGLRLLETDAMLGDIGSRLRRVS